MGGAELFSGFTRESMIAVPKPMFTALHKVAPTLDLV